MCFEIFRKDKKRYEELIKNLEDRKKRSLGKVQNYNVIIQERKKRKKEIEEMEKRLKKAQEEADMEDLVRGSRTFIELNGILEYIGGKGYVPADTPGKYLQVNAVREYIENMRHGKVKDAKEIPSAFYLRKKAIELRIKELKDEYLKLYKKLGDYNKEIKSYYKQIKNAPEEEASLLGDEVSKIRLEAKDKSERLKRIADEINELNGYI